MAASLNFLLLKVFKMPNTVNNHCGLKEKVKKNRGKFRKDRMTKKVVSVRNNLNY